MMSVLSSPFLLLTPSVSSSSLCEDQSSSFSSFPTRQQHRNILLNNSDCQSSGSKKSSLIMSSSSIIISMIICILTTRSFITTTDAFIQQRSYSSDHRGCQFPPRSFIRDQATTIISLLSKDSTRTASTTPRATSTRTISTRLGIAKSGGKMIRTEKEFADNVLSEDLSRPVLVFFTAPWCGPCRLTVPVVKDVMKQYSGELDVVEICTDDLAEVAEESGVVSIPTIQFYYDGSALETHSIVGCVAKSVLSNAIDKVIEDVVQIRQQQSR